MVGRNPFLRPGYFDPVVGNPWSSNILRVVGRRNWFAGNGESSKKKVVVRINKWII